MLRRVDDADSRRLGFLDAIRGLAVLAVLFQHLGEYESDWVRQFSRDRLQFGQLGVGLFFCVSGFIIPVSLERAGDLRTFWTHRFFRLYPAYWLSLAGAAIVVALGWKRSPLHGADDWLANVTMLQHFLARPDAWGPYWTLAWELTFYVLMSALFLFGLHRRAVPILLGVLAVVLSLQFGPWEPPPELRPEQFFNVSLMLCGYAVYRWRYGRLSDRTLAGALALWLVAAILIRADDGTSDATLSAWLVALALFLAIVQFGRTWQAPAWLQRVGVISYSVYLVHPIVLMVVRPPFPAAVLEIMWLAIILAVSELSFRYVERPAIRLGRRASALSRT